MPTKKDYMDASAIVKELADENINVEVLFRLFIPFDNRKGYKNVLKHNNFNWGHDEIKIWDNALKEHRANRPRYATPRRAKKKYLDLSEDLKKRGLIHGIIERILEGEYVQSIGGTFPTKIAYHFDYLFVSLENNYKKRQARLTAILARKHTVTDDVWVKILWDYCNEKSMNLRAEKMVAPYL